MRKPTVIFLGFKKISVRALTASYLIALLVIAGLSIATHAMLDFGLRCDEGSAAIINVTGRQRMLSQRIAALAAEYRLGDPTARDALHTAIATFETAHDSLVSTLSAAPKDDGGANQLQVLYFGSPRALDAQVRDFAAAARRVTDLAPNDPAMAPLLARIFAASRTLLLNDLNQVVAIHQQESERRLRDLEYLQWGILAVVLATLTMEAMVIFRPMIRRIITYTSELVYLASTDPLTGAANRRSFVERSEAEIARAERYCRPLSLVMLDVDRFKLMNDTYGHAAGDAVLRAIGDTLRANLRATDILGRLGGEEFAILLVETNLPAAALLAEKLRLHLAALVIRHGAHELRFTASFGVAPLGAGLENALRIADGLMYEAKRAGRNRIVAHKVLEIA
jgi:diguanylate cyclase (GGDEF)-like protein